MKSYAEATSPIASSVNWAAAKFFSATATADGSTAMAITDDDRSYNIPDTESENRDKIYRRQLALALEHG